MKNVINMKPNGVPIKVWLDNIDDNTWEQVENLSRLPFVHHHIALMPDAHMGYGMCIGGVMATEDVIIPHAVGSDIACGVLAARLPFKEIRKDQLQNIKALIKKAIPMGVGKAHEKAHLMPEINSIINGLCLEDDPTSVLFKHYGLAASQIGTLGAGNHFIEFQKGSDGFIWIMIHSGSRGLGYKVADHYNKVAIELNKKWFSSVNPKHQLAFLPMNTDEGQKYFREMTYCVEYAKQNRLKMFCSIVLACETILPQYHGSKIFIDQIYDVAHNYATLERHFGKNVWVHRKGATKAMKGEIGLIPGSQGSKSYVVHGLGNPDSFYSCSHGAGRLMSRSKAKKELDLATESKKLDKLGVIHGMTDIKNLDEAPGAYKDIEMVMNNQKDLVTVEVELTPIMVLKG